MWVKHFAWHLAHTTRSKTTTTIFEKNKREQKEDEKPRLA